jgi:hypothetical protein
MHHFRSYFLLLLLLVFIGCKSKDETSDCQKFRNGTFRLADEPIPNTYIITRNDSIQTELDQRTNITARFRVKWINECSYEMLYIDQDKTDTDIDSATAALYAEMKKASTVIKITSTGPDYYVFETLMDEGKVKYSDTIWRVK